MSVSAARAQLFDLPAVGPPVAVERGSSPRDLELSEEGPNEPGERAEAPAAPLPAPPAVETPRFGDPRLRVRRPDLSGRPRLRFLASPDFPPFTSLDGRGRPVGYNVELVRGLCEALDALDRCQLQILPWGQLRGALARGDGDAIIAGLAVTAEAREELNFTEPYMRFPARFAARAGSGFDPQRAAGARVGVVARTAHEAMLRSLFPGLSVEALPDEAELQRRLAAGEVDAAFGDGVRLAGWLATPQGRCCGFAGGPYLSEHYLGRGLTIATRAGDAELVEALDWALGRMADTGRMEEIYLRSFPVSFF